MAPLLDVIAQFGPDGLERPGELHVSPYAVVAVLAAGFLVATAGHVVRSRALVAFGLALVFGATVMVPVLLAVAS